MEPPMIPIIELWIAHLEEVREDGIKTVKYSVPELISWLKYIQEGKRGPVRDRDIN